MDGIIEWNIFRCWLQSQSTRWLITYDINALCYSTFFYESRWFSPIQRATVINNFEFGVDFNCSLSKEIKRVHLTFSMNIVKLHAFASKPRKCHASECDVESLPFSSINLIICLNCIRCTIRKRAHWIALTDFNIKPKCSVLHSLVATG